MLDLRRSFESMHRFETAAIIFLFCDIRKQGNTSLQNVSKFMNEMMICACVLGGNFSNN